MEILRYFIEPVVVYFTGTLVGHSIHWLLHQPWAGMLTKSHMSHHFRLYPPHNYTSRVYRDAGSDSTVWVFVPPIVALVVATAILSVTWWMAFINIAVICIGSYLHNIIHDLFHIEGTWLERFSYFIKLRRLHKVHHENMSKNFGIYDFPWDRVFRTFSSTP